ncbi:MAG: TonB-dependent receptor [Armatimonadota bacterium]|nr:TonB-dependent receptor [bacterium]MDW8320431.1 TonB-dependent receptor [Armatimonadota bacterium]
MRFAAFACVLLWGGLAVVCSKPSSAVEPDLTQLSIEQLMQVEVITASKKAQPVRDVPASVYVITAEEIQHSGATSIPEVLRLVPGVHVATIDANKWAVAVRGFNGRYSNKLLVLIDGRTVYTPFFSGVYWDAQPPLFLQDIERIEVIRGPGGTLWGANAVNGVINIITKSAKDTQGALWVSGGGGEEKAFGGLRVGGRIGARGYYRVYTLYQERDALQQDRAYVRNHDDWLIRRSGIRVDWNRTEGESFVLHAEAYGGRIGQRLNIPDPTLPGSRIVDDRYTTSGYYLMGTWNRQRGNITDTLYLYYDHYARSPMELTEVRDTFDVSWQQRIQTDGKHDWLWGLEYKRTSDKARGALMRLTPPSKTDHIFGVFVQDDITLNAQTRLTIGSKLENNSYTAWEIQPNLRLLWKPDARRVWWAAVSRAVRMPTRAERSIAIDAYYEGMTGGLPMFSRIYGSAQFRSEEVTAYELGYRCQLHDRACVDVSAFYNVYRNLRSFEPANPFVETTPVPHIVIPVYMSNKLYGRTYGFELSANWNVTESWTLKLGYADLTYRLQFAPDSSALFNLHSDSTSNTPRHQWKVSSHWNLPGKWSIDAYLFFVDRLFGMDFLPSYYRLDISIGWRPRKDVELSLVMQNLLKRKIREFEHPLWERDSIPQRAVYGRISWRF